MKPVHVANGLARRLIGTTTDHTPLARILRQFVENQRGGFKEERNPNAAILDEYGACFADHFGNPPTDEVLTRFRSLAKDTLGADDAVFSAIKVGCASTGVVYVLSSTHDHRRCV